MKNITLVAEKPSIARKFRIAFSTVKKITFKTIKGKSRYNPIFKGNFESEMEFVIQNGDDKSQKISIIPGDILRITSVTGHVSSFDYLPPYDKKTSWQDSDPKDLIDLDAIEIPINPNLTSQLEELGKNTNFLCIATDFDNQGESIGAQIDRYIKKGSDNPNSVISSRMRFTSTTVPALISAFEQQTILDLKLVESVDSLRRQDLRMGASITRFLTVGVQALGHKKLISYGPCQSSVLWIVTNRYLERLAFIPEPFWLLQAIYTINKNGLKLKSTPKKMKKRTKSRKNKSENQTLNENTFVFDWIHNPILNEEDIVKLVNLLKNLQSGQLINQTQVTETIDRPKPLDTDTLESDGARLFRVSPKLIADVAEKLYNNGYITYPRTESSYYLLKDLSPICKKFLADLVFKSNAKECLDNGNPKNPSKGRFTKDHEPIMPVKAGTENEIASAIKGSDFENNIAWRIYEYVVRRFFATIYLDAELEITSTKIKVKKEEFLHTAQKIRTDGFLSLYPYRKIRESSVPPIKPKTSFEVEITSEKKHTLPPPFWTESQLIRETARLNIGTDATRSQHIATVVGRGFANVQKGNRSIIPTDLGIAFYNIFTMYSEKLISPQIRETVEKWTEGIRTGENTSANVDKLVKELTLSSMKKLEKEKGVIFPILSEGIKKSTKEGLNFGICDKCNSNLILKSTVKGKRYLECSNVECKQSYPVPKKGELTLLPERCRACPLYPIQVGSGTKSWIYCPKCWVERKDSEGLMFCNKCNYENCPYSSINWTYKTKHGKGRLGACPDCENGQVILYFEEWKSFVECESCKKQWKAPNIRAGTSIEVDGPCKLCNLSTLLIKRKGKSPYNMCPICSLLCFQCIHRCYG